ncbi:MAG: hypothetical protein JW959_12035 [Pirellulales bacterium]|nr:hypothetical protein [Pirellulales bacterium]
MQKPLIPRQFGVILTAGAIFLPIAILVTLGVAALLAGMGDLAGGKVIRKIALAGSILWIIDLACLLVVLAIDNFIRPDDADEP